MTGKIPDSKSLTEKSPRLKIMQSFHFDEKETISIS